MVRIPPVRRLLMKPKPRCVSRNFSCISSAFLPAGARYRREIRCPTPVRLGLPGPTAGAAPGPVVASEFHSRFLCRFPAVEALVYLAGGLRFRRHNPNGGEGLARRSGRIL